MTTRVAPDEDLKQALEAEIECECMLCDLAGEHDPIEWRVWLHFPGPYPEPGDEVMLLCQHCRDEWVDGEWHPPYDNFSVVSCVRV